MRKIKVLCTIATSALTLSLLFGCNSKGPAQTEVPDSSEPGYVEVPELDESLVAQDEEKELTVHYLPQGYAIMESAGQVALFGGCAQEDVQVVDDYLKEQEVQTLTTIVVPNSDTSRWSGVELLRDIYGQNMVVVSRFVGDEAHEQFKVRLGNMKIEVGSGSSFNVGTVTFQVLGPVVTEVDDPMSASLVLWGECGESSFLFADDATEEEVNSVLAAGVDMKARYIFLNSRGETTLPYLQLAQWARLPTNCLPAKDLQQHAIRQAISPRLPLPWQAPDILPLGRDQESHSRKR